MDESTRMIARILEARFGKAEANALMFSRARLERLDVQFNDVRHMSEICQRYRARLRLHIVAYRLWKSAYDIQTSSVERLYGAVEGDALHRRVSDELKLWYFAHKDYHALRRAYLFKCVGPQFGIVWNSDRKGSDKKGIGKKA